MNTRRIAFLGALALGGYAVSAAADWHRTAITRERIMRLSILLITQLLKSQISASSAQVIDARLRHRPRQRRTQPSSPPRQGKGTAARAENVSEAFSFALKHFLQKEAKDVQESPSLANLELTAVNVS
jgi:hypothetical protein